MSKRDLPKTEEEILFFLKAFASGATDQFKLNLLEKGASPLNNAEEGYLRLGAESSIDYILTILGFMDETGKSATDFLETLNIYLKMNQTSVQDFEFTEGTEGEENEG